MSASSASPEPTPIDDVIRKIDASLDRVHQKAKSAAEGKDTPSTSAAFRNPARAKAAFLVIAEESSSDVGEMTPVDGAEKPKEAARSSKLKSSDRPKTNP